MLESFSQRVTGLGSDLWFGLTLPARSVRLILSRPKLMAWSTLPITLTLVFSIFVLTQFQAAIQAALLRYFEVWGLPQEGWVAVAASVAVRLLLFLAGALTFSFAATIISSPMNDFLAEATESALPSSLSKPTVFGWKGKLRLLWMDGAKAVATLGFGILALALSWVPLLNLLALGLTFFLLAFQYLSYPQTRRGMGLSASLRFALRGAPAVLGFGAVQMFLFSIPFVSALFLPVAVVGGTLLYARLER